MTTLQIGLIIIAALLILYIILRFTFGYRRLWMIEEMECDRHHNHHEERNR
jgi:hypothetical protein